MSSDGLTIELGAQLAERVKKAAAIAGVSVNELVCRALEFGIDGASGNLHRGQKSQLIEVIEVKALDSKRLWLRFSDGTEGVYDMTDILASGGPMVQPLRDPAVFSRVFLEHGVPTWPNGYDMDAINLHMELEGAGELRQPASAK